MHANCHVPAALDCATGDASVEKQLRTVKTDRMQNESISGGADFTGKVAIVTGGAWGIGLACATLLAERGASVWSADLEPTDKSADQLKQLGVASRRCDVRVEGDVVSLVAEVVAASGRLDILVNNAGVGCVGNL